ncbi:hypothetical protein BLNAU_21644 [Blattamonas nauphoetae]|uniref:Uncharacterized protein n=1 Tax=Blattamonas nauphoetae TaxID=2049346 RepID=A0ABQ9WVC8_9EUKA|nr:hypothetical protein BLNAU_21644 [Blattamonas nauphoetae]
MTRLSLASYGPHNTHPSVDLATIVPDCLSLWLKYSKQRSTFEYQSELYASLVSLIKAEYPLEDSLQDEAVLFLKNLHPIWYISNNPRHFLNYLLPNGNGTWTGFIDSIGTLLSSPYPKIIDAGLYFVNYVIGKYTPIVQYQCFHTDFLSKVLSFVDPPHLPIACHPKLHYNLVYIINSGLDFAVPPKYGKLPFPHTITQNDNSELVFNNVIVPSSEYLHFLCQNRHNLRGDLVEAFSCLLCTLFHVGPYHAPTLEFVLSHRIVMTSLCLFSFGKNHIKKRDFHMDMDEYSHPSTTPLVTRVQSHSGKRLVQVLLSVGFEDTLEQILMTNTG